jgi:hypothetical protein
VSRKAFYDIFTSNASKPRSRWPSLILFSLDGGIYDMILGLRSWIRVIGVLLTACGAICVPKGAGAHPYYFTLTFSYLVESGALFRIGVALVPLGVTLIIASLVGDPFRRRPRDGYYR